MSITQISTYLKIDTPFHIQSPWFLDPRSHAYGIRFLIQGTFPLQKAVSLCQFLGIFVVKDPCIVCGMAWYFSASPWLWFLSTVRNESWHLCTALNSIGFGWRYCQMLWHKASKTATRTTGREVRARKQSCSFLVVFCFGACHWSYRIWHASSADMTPGTTT